MLNDRFGNELRHEIALHLATLSILHDHVNFSSITSATTTIQPLKSSSTNSTSSSSSGSASTDGDNDEEDADECLFEKSTSNLINFKDIE